MFQLYVYIFLFRNMIVFQIWYLQVSYKIVKYTVIKLKSINISKCLIKLWKLLTSSVPTGCLLCNVWTHFETRIKYSFIKFYNFLFLNKNLSIKLLFREIFFWKKYCTLYFIKISKCVQKNNLKKLLGTEEVTFCLNIKNMWESEDTFV